MRVVVGTDGSAAAAVAVDLVAGIDWPAGSTIRVVEAIETGAALLGGAFPAPVVVQDDALETDLRKTAREAVELAGRLLARPGLDVTAAVLTGRPATVIVDAARALDADLIVVGSRGLGTIESMLLGSVSAEVIDHAAIPVLVARGPGIARVLLAWDASDAARAGADLVRDWPIFARSSVRVVSVADLEVPWWTGFSESDSPEGMPMYLEAADSSRRVHDALAKDLVAELGAAGREAEPDRRDGDAATQIIAAARGSKAELIVIGTHGRTGLARLVIGSVARNVLHHAPCSVLITRAPVPLP